MIEIVEISFSRDSLALKEYLSIFEWLLDNMGDTSRTLTEWRDNDTLKWFKSDFYYDSNHYEKTFMCVYFRNKTDAMLFKLTWG